MIPFRFLLEFRNGIAGTNTFHVIWHVIISEFLQGDGGPIAPRILSLVPDGVDFVLDTTGVASVMREAIDVLAPRGMFGFVTAPLDGSDLTLAMRPLMKGRKIAGIMEGNSNPQLFIPRLVDFHMQGRFPIDRLVRFYPFDEIGQAFHDSEEGTAVKPILKMG